MKKPFLILVCGLLWCLICGITPASGQDNPDLARLELADENGKKIDLDSLRKFKLVVVIFTSSHCSWALQYQERLNQLYEDYKDKSVAFLAINSNDPSMSARDSASRMRDISDYKFPYIKDQDQKIAKMFGATKNPEVFVIQPREKGFAIVYQGKIDDNPLSAKMVTKSSLKEAIQLTLNGKTPPEARTQPRGCEIRWIKEVPDER